MGNDRYYGLFPLKEDMAVQIATGGVCLQTQESRSFPATTGSEASGRGPPTAFTGRVAVATP